MKAAYTELLYFNARFYDPQLGRFISADTIVPRTGDPQAWNRYSFVFNNPLKYVDPSGYDPLDWTWREEFYDQHGRWPNDWDIQDRLFSLIYPGSANDGSWTDGDWEWYRSHRDHLFSGNLPWKNSPGKPGLERFRQHVSRLATYYRDNENDQFVHAMATLFAGIPYTLDPYSAAISVAEGPVLSTLNEGMAGWNPAYCDSLGQGDNTHHYVGLFYLGYIVGNEDPAMWVNHYRDEDKGEFNQGDIDLGDLAARQGARYAREQWGPNAMLYSPSQLTVRFFSALKANTRGGK